MNVRLLAGIGSLAFSLAASAAPSADVIELAFTAASASRGYPRIVERLIDHGARDAIIQLLEEHGATK